MKPSHVPTHHLLVRCTGLVRSRDRGIGSRGGAEREGQSKRNLIEKTKTKRKEDKYDQEESEERNKDSQDFWLVFFSTPIVDLCGIKAAKKRTRQKKRGGKSIANKGVSVFYEKTSYATDRAPMFCALHGPELDSKIKTAAGSEFSIKCDYLGLASVRAVNALGLQRDGLGELSGSAGVGGSDLDRLHLDKHLVVLARGLGAGVLLVGAATLATTVVKDRDHGGAARLVHTSGSGVSAEQGGGNGGSGASLHNLTAASLHGHHRGEGSSGANEGED